MADGALSIKLRCASWQQLATIYKRDLLHGAMFFRASTPPAIGTPVRIDLALPSATVIVLTGVVHGHVQDPQRGAGVELRLAPIPAGSVWLIESALASEHKRLATPVQGTTLPASAASSGPAGAQGPVPAIGEGAEVASAEQELIKALVAEAESLKKLNPFLVLGVGYEATDREVRAAFGELTKRYHPDRFARYESLELRKVSEEIFILIRDAYRRLGDAVARAQLLQSLDQVALAPRVVPGPARAPAAVSPPPRSPRTPGGQAIPAPPAPAPAPAPALASAPASAVPGSSPVVPPGSSSDLRGGTTQRTAYDASWPPASVARWSAPTQPPPISDALDVSPIEDLIDQGRLDEALAAYKVMGKRHPNDRNLRAGVELCEGLLALGARERLEAAQRFEAALEIDPSNERAARALADMRRQATNERKGLLSRLMGKQEP